MTTATDPRRLTERQCQDKIIDAAKLGGWLVHAGRPARTANGWATAIQGHAGFPDLVLVHPRRGLWFVELKRKPNKVEPAQQLWLSVIRDAPGSTCVRVLWVPEQMDEFIAWLTERAA